MTSVFIKVPSFTGIFACHPVFATKKAFALPMARQNAPTQRRRHTLQSCAAPLQLLLPRYHFALPAQCRPLTRSPTPHCAGLRTPLTEGSRLELHDGRFCPLSPKLLAGEGQTAPCCRLAQPTAFCKR